MTMCNMICSSHHLFGWVGEHAPLLMHNVCRLLRERRRPLLDHCCFFQRFASRLESRPVVQLPVNSHVNRHT